MAKTLTLRLDDKQAEIVEELMRYTNQNTASKAIIEAITSHISNAEALIYQTGRVIEEQERISVLQARIEGARSAAALLLEQVGQGDLLD